MSGSSFEDLEIWQRSSRLAVRLYEALSVRNGFWTKNDRIHDPGLDQLFAQEAV